MPTDPNYRREDYAWVKGENGRETYKYVGPHAEREEASKGPQVRVIPDGDFVSTSLPKNWEIHKRRGGRFVEEDGGKYPRGSVIFDNHRQREAAVHHANDEGENVVYGGPGGDIMPR